MALREVTDGLYIRLVPAARLMLVLVGWSVVLAVGGFVGVCVQRALDSELSLEAGRALASRAMHAWLGGDSVARSGPPTWAQEVGPPRRRVSYALAGPLQGHVGVPAITVAAVLGELALERLWG